MGLEEATTADEVLMTSPKDISTRELALRTIYSAFLVAHGLESLEEQLTEAETELRSRPADELVQALDAYFDVALDLCAELTNVTGGIRHAIQAMATAQASGAPWCPAVPAEPH